MQKVAKGDLVKILEPVFVEKALYNTVGIVMRVREAQRVGLIEYTDPRRIYKEHPEIYAQRNEDNISPLYLVYTNNGRTEELFGDEIEVISSIS